MKKNHNKGNVLFIILIAVGLFAALSYAVSNGMRGGGDIVTDKQANIAAGEFLRAMQDIRQGYQFLWTNQGCSIDEISFVKAGKVLSGGEDFDALSPRADENCDIFSPNGANVNYPENLARYQIPDVASTNPSKGFLFFSFRGFSNNFNVQNLGTSASEDIVFFRFIDKKVCDEINRILGYDDYDTYVLDIGGVIGDEDTRLQGKSAGCYDYKAPGDLYMVYYVLQEF